jgi:hypothetical protein
MSKSRVLGNLVSGAGVIEASELDPNLALGGPSEGTDSIIRTNSNVIISEAITISADSNGVTIGPEITIDTGGSVTVEGNWTII